MTIPNKVAQKIKHVREEKNYSQQHLADSLGMSQKAYSKLENGETNLSVNHLMKISEVLQVNIGELLDASGISIYNNYKTHKGEGIVINKYGSDEVIALYDKLLKAKDNEIELLKRLLEKNE